MKFTYDEDVFTAKYVQQGIVQGGIGICGSKDFPSVYVRIKDPDVFRFIQIIISGKFLACLKNLI